MIIARPSRGLERLLAAAAMVAGTAAWISFLRADLVLSHYDARAHLVVARRVLDSLTPGWQQIGAVWLPLPHLLQIVPSQVDLFYRTGAAGSFMSIASFGIAAYAAARIVIAATGSAIGATTAVALLALNPNLLYLQSTPMTEPLLLAVDALVVLWLFEWVQDDRDNVPVRLGLALFAAAWTRYEAWAVIGVALLASAYAMWRRGATLGTVAGRTARLVAWPAAAVLIFLINSRVTVGSWFVSDGFYVPDPLYQGQSIRTLVGVWWGTHQLSGYIVEIVGLLTAMVLAARAVARPADARLLIPVALFAAAALPLYAFYEGHPYRIRYMIPPVAACTVFAGLAVGYVQRLQVRAMAGAGPLLAAVLVASALIESPPWDRNAPMLQEAQWDRPASAARRAVSRCLAKGYRGDKVLASMGSLAHYMQELSSEGFALSDFVHEGNGAIWNLAMESGARAHVGWMLVEEQAEGGDVIAQRLRRDPAFADGMTRICEGGGVALYERHVKG